MRLLAQRESPGSFGSTLAREQAFTADRWREHGGRCAWYTASSAGEPVGLVAGRDGGAVGSRDLISLWVAPAHRGRGAAGLLVEAVRRWAVAEGAAELALWVVEGNTAAAAVYMRSGFVPTGRRKPLSSDPAVVEEQWILPLPADLCGR